MKFIVPHEEILPRLQLISKVIQSKSTYPMLDNFKIELNQDLLKITGTDLQTTITSTLQVNNSEGEGSVAVDAKRLLNILKELPEQPLIFEIDDEKKSVTIITQNGKYTIGGYSTEDYPEPPVIDENEAYKISIKGSILSRAISKTIFSVATEEIQLVMTGILFELKEDNITFVASDGHKLVRYRRFDIQPQQQSSFILPKKPAELIKNILAKTDEDVEIIFNDRNAVFKIASYEIISRLIEGQFPNYEVVIPTDNPNKLIIDRDELLKSIKRVSIFAEEATKLVKLAIEANQVTISAQDIDFSIAAEEVLPCNYEGEPMKIGFKSTFIMEILNNLDSDEVRIEMSEPTKAALILPTEKEDENEDELMLLMPMMLDETE